MSDIASFDWYQASVHGFEPDQVVGAFLRADPVLSARPGRPKNGYDFGADLVAGDVVRLRVWWGGNAGVHVIATGGDSPWAAGVLRASFPHECTRVDSCVDWDEPGLFDDLAANLIAYAKSHRIAINQQGDWVRGMARTLYLGSPSSDLRLVVYEKGYQVGGSPHWVRLEVRAKPGNKAARASLASASPGDVLGLGWFRGCLAECLGWVDLVGSSMCRRHRKTDAERSRIALTKQYEKVLSAWALEAGGWDRLGDAMRSFIFERAEREAEIALREMKRAKLSETT